MYCPIELISQAQKYYKPETHKQPKLKNKIKINKHGANQHEDFTSFQSQNQEKWQSHD